MFPDREYTLVLAFPDRYFGLQVLRVIKKKGIRKQGRIPALIPDAFA